MKSTLPFLFFLCVVQLATAQITGQITDAKNEGLPFVSVYLENTYKGTTSNDAGFYELNLEKTGDYVLVFQSLGFKTVKKSISIDRFPFEVNVQLSEENVSLDEVVVNVEENPANIIMRKAIDARKANLEKIQSFKADFYSRGLIRIKDAPEKFLGQEVGDLGGGLDSTRSGIIYLSETISKIDYLRPDRLKEKITASKVSGDDNGFSFNNAVDVDFNFYNNTLEFGSEMVSPIANNAFSYYRYRLEGVFYDDRGNLINKIAVTPKRENDPAFSGYIFIVEDQWTIYALELSLNGLQARIPPAEIITLKQSFSYSETDDIWALISQSIDFKYGLFGIKGDGRFTAVFSNYDFNTGLNTKDFGRELVAFEENANKKDSLFWEKIRPVPLTSEEIRDYVKKDSIEIIQNSKPYLDSVDLARNKFKLTNIVTGYTYQNSHKDYRLGYDIPLSSLQFNTVQGFTAGASAFYRKNYDEYKKYLSINGSLEYGFSDERLRGTMRVNYKFNDISDAFLTVSGGTQVLQFNTSNPISPFINSVSTLAIEDNYAKFFERYFAQASYSEELFNGFRFSSTISYEKRNPLFNTTDQVWNNEEGDAYTSNNPLDETAFGVATFESHNILKFYASARINFGQNYLSYPGSKFNIRNEKYPTLVLSYEKGFGSTNDNYNFDQVRAQLFQTMNLGDKGRTIYNLKAGTFFGGDDIAFVDYQHFNGNQTHFSRRGNYTNVFNNLPYYSASTNDSYFEGHLEHDFNGFILGKIPLLRKLNFNLIAGAHLLATPDNKPYQEYSIGLDNIGFGKWRFLRVDYVRSYQSGFQSDAIVFGLKLF
ncbi:DUF5686 and carboxypeptidase regulatory-like domain-containing protein [Winogradskyella maritima]|uniref:DUF5686 and carboxypeptidase regulatory-like domain-containing protein n=1 Tax=Winogradskyella maritima TaxID=1517766 RepID=A0ABV8ACC9_9FLAO|nr:DUF5686 and carboxypeptidase regulatory-like domain-containing protein [Winogradskyella maritima]